MHGGGCEWRECVWWGAYVVGGAWHGGCGKRTMRGRGMHGEACMAGGECIAWGVHGMHTPSP